MTTGSDQPAPDAAPAMALERARARLAAIRQVDTLIARGAPASEFAAAALHALRALVRTGRAAVIAYDQPTGVGRLVAVDEDDPLPSVPVGRSFPLVAVVPAELLAAPATRVFHDIGRELPELGPTPDLLARGYRAAIWSPLVVDGSLFGMLAMGARDASVFEGDAIEIVEEVAAAIAVGLKAAGDALAARNAIARLELVHAVDRAILAAERPAEVAGRAVEALRRLAGADRVAVTTFDLDRRISRILAFSQADALAGFASGTEIPMDAGIPDEVLVERRMLRVPDVAAMAERYPAWRRAADEGMVAALVVPLIAHDRLIGIVSIAGRDARVIGDEAVAVAAEIADQLAIAIEHAAARERVEHQNARLSLMREIDLAILASVSPEDLASRVAAPLARLTGARRLDISAYDLDRDEGRILGFAHDGASRATPVGHVYPLREVVPMAAGADPVVMVVDDLPALADTIPLVRNAVAAGLTHAAWIPLVADGRLLGAIGLAGDDPSLTSAETMGVAKAMGDQLAVALQHAQDRAALGEREERLRAILEASPNGILAVDPGGVVRYANPAAHRLFGAPEGGLDGVPHAALVPPPFDEGHTERIATWFKGDGATVGHGPGTEARRLDGTMFPVHVLLAGIVTGGTRLAIVTVVDLSERTALEARLRQAERLQVLGEFAGILAHDVRNHLTAISWSADLLAEDLPADDPRHADVALIQKATRDAVDMTRSVLEFARPAGDPRGSTDLAAHLAASRSVLDRVLGEGVALEVDVEPHLPPVAVSATALTQVVGNLASNARDAMPRGGTFRLRARHHHVGAGSAEPGSSNLEPGAYVRLEVADTGAGMDEATRDRAFEAFYTTKTGASTARGTGLGLSSVFLIVTKCGGSIHVASEPGQGTTFTVDLPTVG